MTPAESRILDDQRSSPPLSASDAPYAFEDVQVAFGTPMPYATVQRRDDLPCAVAATVALDDRLSVAEAIFTIVNADPGVHDALVRLAARWAHLGVPREDAQLMLSALLDQGDDGTARMAGHRADLNRAVDSAYAKFYFPDTSAALPADPLDVFAAPGTKGAYDPADYPIVISRLAQDVARRMGCSPEIVVWTAIVVAAALIDDKVQVQVKAHDITWRESARLWVAILGDPSVKKSPGMAVVLGAVSALERRLWSDYRSQHDQWKQAAAAAKRDGQVIPTEPQPVRFKLNDTTIEAAIGVLVSNPSGILLSHDELSGFFGSQDAYRANGASKDRPFWLTTYNGGGYTVDRVSKGVQYAPNASVSIIGGIQPEPMRRIASKLDDDGLLQRFIVVPAAAAGPGSDVPADLAALQGWKNEVERLWESRDDVLSTWPLVVRFSPEAQALVDAARQRLYALSRCPTTDPRFASALAKGEAQLARIALVFHCLVNRSGEDGRAPGAEIAVSTAAMAVRAFERLVVPSAAAFYSEVIGLTTSHADARWIAGHILAHQLDAISERDIYRAKSDFRDEQRYRIEAAMGQLELAGWVAPKTGRGTAKAWSVNPRVHALFASFAERERASRTATVAMMREQAPSAEVFREGRT